MHVLRLLAGLVLAVSVAGSSWGGTGDLKIGAGDAAAENILKPVKEAFEKANNVQLIIIDSGAKVAFADLKRANLDAAAAGVSYPDWLGIMKREGIDIEDTSFFQPVTIGRDHIVVITNKDNPVQELSSEQLRGIFSGTLDNWNQVGGPDLPIMVVWGSLMQETNSAFQSAFLAGSKLVPDVLDATTSQDVRENVAANPTAIGIGPAGIIDGTIASPKTPLLSRDITVIYRANPPESLLKLIDFIKKDGKQYITAPQ